MMWTVYAGFAFLFATIVSVITGIVLYYVAGPMLIDKLTSLMPGITTYACNGDGTCSIDQNGAFQSESECLDYCDRAQCIVLSNSTECSHAPGNYGLETMEQCKASCGTSRKPYLCDTSQGCRLALSTETGVFEDHTCGNTCMTYDLSSNGTCMLLPQDPISGAKYASKGDCVRENYTWSCTDYRVDNDGPTCTQDSGRISGHAENLDECMKSCNPNLYATCESGVPDDIETLEGELGIVEVCQSKSEGVPCFITMNTTSASTGGNQVVQREGVCQYCANAGGVSNMYCGPNASGNWVNVEPLYYT